MHEADNAEESIRRNDAEFGPTQKGLGMELKRWVSRFWRGVASYPAACRPRGRRGRLEWGCGEVLGSKAVVPGGAVVNTPGTGTTAPAVKFQYE